MARKLVFRNPDGEVVRVDVVRVSAVKAATGDRRKWSVIHYRSGITKLVVGNYRQVQERIISNKKMEIEKANATFKEKLEDCAGLSDKFLKRYLEIKAGL